MLRAVSSLSPVRTQSLMPAVRMLTIVSATPSCSLSSMPVAPTISRSTSSFSAAAASRASRSCNAVCAASYSACHDANSSAPRLRRASTRVRRPSWANSARCACSSESDFAARSSITLSAPFASTSSSPVVVRATTDIRFLAELNALTARISYFRAPGPAAGSSATSTDRLCPARFRKFQPNAPAASTSAPSSGLSASYLTVPHWSVVAMTVWDTARISRKASKARAVAASDRLAICIASAPSNPLDSVTSPKTWLATETRFSSMTFWVRVPVLSEKMYDTCPSSWHKFVDRTRAGQSCNSSYIPKSFLMKYAWAKLHTSIAA
mmetsp:Transcript_36699/g.110895  ORF Transcript_36699/g.110895 Transcript_36699/m.110895 type:complete len:323 (+) Transcript_36699:1235-2203(+)